MSRVVAAINPVLPGLARRKGVAHHPHGGSFATWTLTLAIRLVWLGPVACVAMTDYISTDKPFGIYLINQSYVLIFLVMMGAILGAWR